MNKLKPEKEKTVLDMLVEGNSIRGIARMTGIDKNTVQRVLLRTAERCQDFLDQNMTNLHCDALEVDEAWTFVQKKQRLLNRKEKAAGVLGDQYIWVALDRDTKLIPVHLVAKRTGESAYRFLVEVRRRVVNTSQITTDQFGAYKTAMPLVFGNRVHFATLRKSYAGNKDGRERYSPPKLRRVFISEYIGNPNRKKICTSYVERHNLTMRTQIKRMTRLTNAFSKTTGGLRAALSLHFWNYNFRRIHQSLKMTPAMKAGLCNCALDWDIVI